jgi:hypothetical protein
MEGFISLILCAGSNRLTPSMRMVRITMSKLLLSSISGDSSVKVALFIFASFLEVKPIVRAEDLLFGLVLSEYESVVDKKNERDLQDSRQLQLVVYLVIGPVISCLSRRSARKNPESYCISLV